MPILYYLIQFSLVPIVKFCFCELELGGVWQTSWGFYMLAG